MSGQAEECTADWAFPAKYLWSRSSVPSSFAQTKGQKNLVLHVDQVHRYEQCWSPVLAIPKDCEQTSVYLESLEGTCLSKSLVVGFFCLFCGFMTGNVVRLPQNNVDSNWYVSKLFEAISSMHGSNATCINIYKCDVIVECIRMTGK